ncbi:MAG: polyribonucleotide nucleotidyltransferase [Anaerolineae bacterium]|nr:polyribonucleotide nucleotidyltransferase [Anaerolineae bacterium]MCO5205925.1 polyribonucleotide nucleotidyltransferase [Anaerolineae bacterium]
MNEEHRFTTKIGDHEITVKTGKLAFQAGGAVIMQQGEAIVLATATMSSKPREGMNFFPLSVDFEEKLYAVGRIPGSFFKREGRPTTASILTSRLTDRPLRPLFPDGMRNEVQLIITALSADQINFLDILTVNAASTALTISDIPWNGPIGAVRIGYIDGQLVANPTIQQMEESQLDLKLAGSRDAIIMVEAGADEVSEALMIEALEFGHKALQPLIDMQLDMREKVGKPKREIEFIHVDADLRQRVQNAAGDRILDLVTNVTDRHERNEGMRAITDDVIDEMTDEEDGGDNPSHIYEVLQDEQKYAIRNRILNEGIRPDGRSLTQVRELSSEVGLLPRTHGSGLFQRGETQVLSLATLGMPREAQKLDGLEPEERRRYLHHYNFPPFSTGETWFLRGPKRREIGHGALAETALRPMIPSEEEFPYTIRVVSEVLSSNGSTSQASVCASSLALMDCGVPIKKVVGGVAMGLIYDDKSGKYAILTDIQGLEDHLGDMDFKVAGSKDGITAIQMDIKISGLSMDLMREALEQARIGRIEIIDSMLAVMPAPRAELSESAPRMMTIKIDPSQIGTVIGKGGATVRSIQDEYEVSIDIAEDGTVFIAGVDGEKADEALRLIEQMTRGAELGEIYDGKVTRTVDFGAFVEIIPGIEGLVHISQISRERIDTVEDAIKVGDQIMVMVTNIDGDNGKIRLSRRAVLEGWTLEEARDADRGTSRSGSSRGNRNNRGRDRRR